MRKSKLTVVSATIILSAFLAACGSDSGTDSGIAQAETIYGLGECEESNEGVIKLVTSDSTYYKCEDGDWEETDAPPSSSSASPWGNNGGKTNFTPGNTFRDFRDGQTYRTVKIGGQVWMAENLNYAYTGVPFDNGYYTFDSTSWCYDNDPANCAKYGRLYTWAAAVGRAEDECGYGNTCGLGSGDIRGICPKGWHLPSHDEWESLIVAVDGSITEYTYPNTAGTKLKSATGWAWDDYDDISGNGRDAFGFSALPAGNRNIYGSYNYEGNPANFWSSTEYNSDDAYYMSLYYYVDDAYLGHNDKYDGYSVRCLKD